MDVIALFDFLLAALTVKRTWRNNPYSKKAKPQ